MKTTIDLLKDLDNRLWREKNELSQKIREFDHPELNYMRDKMSLLDRAWIEVRDILRSTQTA